jgi:hypothetical protein
MSISHGESVSKKKEWPKLETEDMFDNKIVAGNIVMFPRRNGLEVGIFIRENETSYSIAVKEPYYGYKDGQYQAVRDFKLVQTKQLFLIEDPIHKLNVKVVQNALDIVPELKTGKHLPKDFDESISWGSNQYEEE